MPTITNIERVDDDHCDVTVDLGQGPRRYRFEIVRSGDVRGVNESGHDGTLHTHLHRPFTYRAIVCHAIAVHERGEPRTFPIEVDDERDRRHQTRSHP